MRLRSFSHWSRGPRARQFMARRGADFNLLVPGALHRANGGYLILDAPKLLVGNYGWPSLSRRFRRRRDLPHRSWR
jgi:hypothetical protein